MKKKTRPRGLDQICRKKKTKQITKPTYKGSMKKQKSITKGNQ